MSVCLGTVNASCRSVLSYSTFYFAVCFFRRHYRILFILSLSDTRVLVKVSTYSSVERRFSAGGGEGG